MKVPFLDLKLQHKNLQKKLNISLSRVFSSAAFLGGNETEKFKKLFSSLSSSIFTIPCSNGTSALYIGLKAAGMKPGDEVVTVANTFIATAEALSLAGASIKLVDVDKDTYNMDINKLEKILSKKTRFIVPVFLYGLPANMEAIMSLARKYKCKVIADACQAHGSIFPYNGLSKKAGSVADCSAFSFYPGKNLGASGDAGALTTSNKAIAQKAFMLANHGISKNRYQHECEAFNFRMDNIQAAVINIKIPQLQKWNKARRKIASLYSKAFKNTSFKIPVFPKGYFHVYHLYVIQVKNRDELQKKLMS